MQHLATLTRVVLVAKAFQQRPLALVGTLVNAAQQLPHFVHRHLVRQVDIGARLVGLGGRQFDRLQRRFRGLVGDGIGGGDEGVFPGPSSRPKRVTSAAPDHTLPLPTIRNRLLVATFSLQIMVLAMSMAVAVSGGLLSKP